MYEKKVSVLIPAYNEADKIKDTVHAVQLIPAVHEVVVVDDASSDHTAELARAAGARVFSMSRNSGKGAALNAGVLKINYEIIALLDADLGQTAAEARWLVLPVLEGKADMTIAGFPPARKKGGFGLVKGLAVRGIERHAGLRMNSPLSGQRVMTRRVLESILPFASGYGVEVALTIKAAAMGFKIMEVPVQMHHAETGRDMRGFIHRGRQFVDIIKVLASLKWARLKEKGA